MLLVVGAAHATAAMPFTRSQVPASPPIFPIPVQELSARQQAVQQILRDPTLVARGPAEKFACKPEHYYFFLEHPDRAVTAWRKLGAKCVAITDKGGHGLGKQGYGSSNLRFGGVLPRTADSL